MALDLSELGISKDDLVERIVEAMVDRLTTTYTEDGDIDGGYLGKRLKIEVQKRVDDAVSRLADKHVLPNVTTYLESLCLQKTTEWGEKKGDPVTFIEYLAKRADEYMREQVNHDGKGKGEDSYGWSAKQTRITYLVNRHLQYSIETAMKESLKVANESIVGGIEAVVKVKLAEISAGIKVGVSVKS